MDQLKSPNEFPMEGDVAVNFQKWKQQFEIYLLASGIKDNQKMSEERKVAILLHCLGTEGQEVFNTLDISEEDKKKWEKVLEHLEAHFKTKENETINRHLFHTRKQKEGETIDMFLTDLKKLSMNCNFGELRDSLIRDRVVCGILDNRVRDSLLREASLDLTKCITICKASELAGMRSKQLNQETGDVHGIKREENTPEKYNRRVSTKEDTKREKEDKKEKCMACGWKHGRKCPAFKKKCRKCNAYNHFEKNVFPLEKSTYGGSRRSASK